MKIDIVAIGKLKAGPERELAGRYFDRLVKAGPAVGLEFGRLVERPESRASGTEARKRDEADAIRAACVEGGRLVVLDEGGRMPASEEFAQDIARWRDDGVRHVTFVIGGADGLDAGVIAEADLRIAFGRLTWPHQIVRVLLAEQLYRTATILAGHPYHRE
jgi:23S rRNA (pseudouridine1915-N3)-methyltransferase